MKRIVGKTPAKFKLGPQLILGCLLVAILCIIFWSYMIAHTMETNKSHQVAIDKKLVYLRSEFAREVKNAQGKLHGASKWSSSNKANSSQLMKLLESIDSEFTEAQSIFSGSNIEKRLKNRPRKSYRTVDELMTALLTEERRQMLTLHTDKIINSLEYFPIMPNQTLLKWQNTTVFSISEANAVASAAIHKKGVYRNESYIYVPANVQTFSRVYEYHHKYDDPCLVIR